VRTGVERVWTDRAAVRLRRVVLRLAADAILRVMWTYLANWLVQDGEVPELHLGARLRQAAVRAACWTMAESEQAEGVRELTTDEGDAHLPDRYAMTGIVEKANEPNSVLLRVGSTHFFAEPDTFRSVGTEGALRPYSSSFRIPKSGSKVSIECRLEVMASHEALDLVWGLRYQTSGATGRSRPSRSCIAYGPEPDGHKTGGRARSSASTTLTAYTPGTMNAKTRKPSTSSTCGHPPSHTIRLRLRCVRVPPRPAATTAAPGRTGR